MGTEPPFKNNQIHQRSAPSTWFHQLSERNRIPSPTSVASSPLPPPCSPGSSHSLLADHGRSQQSCASGPLHLLFLLPWIFTAVLCPLLREAPSCPPASPPTQLKFPTPHAVSAEQLPTEGAKDEVGQEDTGGAPRGITQSAPHTALSEVLTITGGWRPHFTLFCVCATRCSMPFPLGKCPIRGSPPPGQMPVSGLPSSFPGLQQEDSSPGPWGEACAEHPRGTSQEGGLLRCVSGSSESRAFGEMGSS